MNNTHGKATKSFFFLYIASPLRHSHEPLDYIKPSPWDNNITFASAQRVIKDPLELSSAKTDQTELMHKLI